MIDLLRRRGGGGETEGILCYNRTEHLKSMSVYCFCVNDNCTIHRTRMEKEPKYVYETLEWTSSEVRDDLVKDKHGIVTPTT